MPLRIGLIVLALVVFAITIIIIAAIPIILIGVIVVIGGILAFTALSKRARKTNG